MLHAGGYVVFVWNTMDFAAHAVLCGGTSRFTLRYFKGKAEPEKGRCAAGCWPIWAKGRKYENFANEQQFDLAGITGRLLSTSYAPLKGDPKHESMLAELTDLFTAHANENDRIHIPYITELLLPAVSEPL